MKTSLPLLAAVILSLTPLSAAAQTNTAMPEDNNAGTGFIGVSVLSSSEYFGSADEDLQVLPYLSLENVKGFDLFATNLSYRAIEIGTGQGLGKWSLRAGPSLRYQQGRDSDDSPNLAGFEDVDGSLLAGGYVRTTLGPLGIVLDAGQDVIGGHSGFTANASIGTFYRSGAFAVQPSFTVSWGDNDFNDSFFSVTDEQAANSSLAAYDASSGVFNYSAGLVTWVEFSDQYALSFIGSYSWFTGDADESPILTADDGSDNGFFAALSLSRKFDTNKW